MNGPLIRFFGNVTRKGEMQYTNNDGTPFLTIGVASNSRHGDQEETLFLDVTIWRHTAEYANANLETGTGVYVEGPFRVRHYTRTDGQPGVSYAVSASDFEITTRGAPAALSWARNRPQRQQDAAPATAAPRPTQGQRPAAAPAAPDRAQPQPVTSEPDPYDDDQPDPLNDLPEDQDYQPEFMDEG